MKNDDKLSFFDRIKGELEYVEMKLSLGAKELEAEFDQQKTRFRSLLEDAKVQIQDLEKIGEDKIKEATAQFDSLIDLLDADPTLSYSEFEDSPKKVSDAIHQVDENFHLLLESAESEEAREKLKEHFNKAKDEFIITLQLQQKALEHKRDDSLADFEKWKEELKQEVGSLRQKAEAVKDEASEKIDAFRQELGQAVEHLKAAFTKLR